MFNQYTGAWASNRRNGEGVFHYATGAVYAGAPRPAPARPCLCCLALLSVLPAPLPRCPAASPAAAAVPRPSTFVHAPPVDTSALRFPWVHYAV